MRLQGAGYGIGTAATARRWQVQVAVGSVRISRTAVWLRANFDTVEEDDGGGCGVWQGQQVS